MATGQQARHMENRGLLTADDRAFYRGEKDVEDEEKMAREKRYNVRQRIENIEEDIEILRQAGEDQVVEDFYDAIGRYERLERELAELKEEIGDS